MSNFDKGIELGFEIGYKQAIENLIEKLDDFNGVDYVISVADIQEVIEVVGYNSDLR